MAIKNEPKKKNIILVKIREQLEHRALWMWLLIDGARKKGLDPMDYVPEAIEKCGHMHGKIHREAGKKGDSLKGLKKALFSPFAQDVFEMKIKQCNDDHLDIDFHYCPLVKAWQKAGCSDEDIKMLCHCAMCGDGGIASEFGCHLDLPKTIANGDDICQIRFARNEEKNK